MGSELRYGFGKVLGIQNCPTLRLASHHCVLCLNPIKGTLNTCFKLTHTLNIHLAINMASNIPNHTSIMLANKTYHTSIVLANKTYHTSNHANHFIIDPSVIYLNMLHHIAT